MLILMSFLRDNTKLQTSGYHTSIFNVRGLRQAMPTITIQSISDILLQCTGLQYSLQSPELDPDPDGYTATISHLDLPYHLMQNIILPLRIIKFSYAEHTIQKKPRLPQPVLEANYFFFF